MKRILCIWFPYWPIQRLLTERPELCRRPIVLYTPRPAQGERVVACSPAAESCGVRPEMPLADAASLARDEGATPFYFARHDAQADRGALMRLADRCEAFSPLVGLEAGERPEGLLLDVTGLGSLFGDEERLVQQVMQAYHRRGYGLRAAVAETVGAAWAMAHFAAPASEVRYVIVPPGCSEAVGRLPIEALRLPQETVALLHRLGILRVEEIRRLPRDGLRSRFGQGLARRLDQATGQVEEVLVPHRPLSQPEAQWSLEHATSDRQVVDHVVWQLTQRVADQLTQRGQGVAELICRLACERGESVSTRLGLFQPTAEAKHLMELIRMQLARLTAPGAIEGISVRATVTAPLVWRQYELFPDKSREQPRELAMLIDRLSSRLGSERVVRPTLRATAQPERAFADMRLTSSTGHARSAKSRWGSKRSFADAPLSNKQSRRRSGAIKQGRPAFGPGQRPLWLDRPPLSIDVASVVPDGPPVFFQHGGQTHHVARYWGPERIETGWWRGRSVRRDYYRVQTRDGSRLWIYRQLEDGKWFLHGEFA